METGGYFVACEDLSTHEPEGPPDHLPDREVEETRSSEDPKKWEGLAPEGFEEEAVRPPAKKVPAGLVGRPRPFFLIKL